jgi:predicted cupin superfamily sugar epimerase
MSTHKYCFPGLWSFVNRAAGNRDVHHMGRAREIWHFRQVQEALVNLSELDNRESQRALMAHVLKVRESLAVILKGIDDAASEVAEKFDLYDEVPCPAASDPTQEPPCSPDSSPQS